MVQSHHAHYHTGHMHAMYNYLYERLQEPMQKQYYCGGIIGEFLFYSSIPTNVFAFKI